MSNETLNTMVFLTVAVWTAVGGWYLRRINRQLSDLHAIAMKTWQQDGEGWHRR